MAANAMQRRVPGRTHHDHPDAILLDHQGSTISAVIWRLGT